MKLKRLLTGVLSAVMALSVCAMPAAAADATNNQVTFDPAKKVGSLTIHKYEQTEAESNENKNGKGLNGVTFKAYLVAEIKQEDVNGSIGLTYKIPDTLKTKGSLNENVFNGKTTDQKTDLINYEDVYNDVNAAFSKLSDQEKKALKKGEATTENQNGEDGIAKMENLPLGIYMIQETDAPAQILTHTANFIVSIPMVQGGQWIYDVKAEPKNAPTYGGVNLYKVGVTTGSDAETPLAGVVFRLDKQDGANWKAVDVSGFKFESGGANNDSKKPGKEGFVVTDKDGYIKITSGLTKGVYRFVEISGVGGYIANTDESANEFEVAVDNNGKLYAKKVGGTADEILNPIKVVNEKPDFEKTVAKRGETTSASNHDADYGIDEDVPYTLTITVPEHVEKLNTFKVTDTTLASELKQNEGSIKVVGTAKDGKTIDFTKDTDYKASVALSTANNKNSIMTVDFDPARHVDKMKSVAGGTITITYTSKVQKTAKIAVEGDLEGNLNTANLSYSRTTKTDENESSGSGKEPYQVEDQSVIYSFGVNIKKTSQSGEPLNEVTFDLYKKATAAEAKTLNSGKYTFRGVECEGVTGVKANSLGLTKDDTWLKVATLETKNGGVDKVSGLPAGEYKLVETKTLDGYNLLAEPVDAKLNLEYKTTWNHQQAYDENGKMVKNSYGSTTFNYKDATDTVTPGSTLTIVNRKGFTLPVTGGFGTLLFSGIGVLLVLAGVCVLFSMKKKNNRA